MRRQRMIGTWHRRRHESFVSLACLFLFALCGCASKQHDNASNEDATPIRNIVRTFRIPPFFVEDHPNLRYDVPVKNETGKAVRFSQVRQSCTCMGAANLESKEVNDRARIGR
jgi:hypothetical protein